MEALYGVLHRKGMGGLCYDMESFPVRPRYVDPMLPRFVADLISTMGPVEIAEGSQKTVFIPVLPHPGAEFDFGVPHVRYAAPGVEPANLDGWCTEDLHSADVDIALHKLYCSRVDFRGKVSSPWWLMQVVQNGDQWGFRILSPFPLEVLDPISKVALLTLKTNITRSVAVTSLGGDKRFHEEIPSGPADFGDAYIKKWKLNRGGTEHAIIRIRDEDKAAYDALPDQAGGKSTTTRGWSRRTSSGAAASPPASPCSGGYTTTALPTPKGARSTRSPTNSSGRRHWTSGTS